MNRPNSVSNNIINFTARPRIFRPVGVTVLIIADYENADKSNLNFHSLD